MNTVGKFHYLLTFIIWCNELLFLIILKFTIYWFITFSSVFTHRFIQLFFNVMNRIKIINQVWLGLSLTISLASWTLLRLFLKSLPLYFLYKSIINFTKFTVLMETYESYWKLLNTSLFFFYRLWVCPISLLNKSVLIH